MSEYDLIVIGSGFAGASAALSYCEKAQEAGRSGRVAVVEVGAEDERAGGSRWTMAWMRVYEDNRFCTSWKRLVEETSKGLADLEYCSALEREAPVTMKYLEDHGVEIYQHYENDVALEYETNKSIKWPVGGGLALVNKLLENLRNFDNAEIHYETEAVKLSISDDGRVNGVVVRGRDGALRTMSSKAVVIASGGFEGNPEMLTQYIGENAVDLRPIVPGLHRNKGAGIEMAMDIGADTAGQFDMFHSEVVDSRTSRPDSVIWGHNYGIVVNQESKRFFDEGEDYLFSHFELLAYEVWKNQNQKAFFITDKPIMERMRPGWVFETTDLEPEEGATVAELAEKLGLDPTALEATVAEFNASTPGGPFQPEILDGLGTKGLTPPKSNWANRIESGPFYGYPLEARITFTFGGLRVDTEARVLSKGGAAIPGLYAAGEITGLFYHEYPPASSSIRSMTFGRIAGANAVTYLKGAETSPRAASAPPASQAAQAAQAANSDTTGHSPHVASEAASKAAEKTANR
ncbi:FAD-binding protein [Arthrobacter sp. K5]|uniref:FAD-binding protein n=1 Tax=Arthrobacter sp. K5 TaxID=2839623 RepID=A0AAU8EWX9_9MICC